MLSASATLVNGYDVFYAWRGSEASDTSYDNTVITTVQYNSLRIQLDIVLNEPIKSNNAFDLSVGFTYDTAGEIVLDSVVLYDNDNNRLGTFYAELLDNQVNISTLQVEGEVSYIRFVFNITSPNWREKDLIEEISFIISDTTYKAEKDMTWADWINSDYNSLGLFNDGGYVLGANVQLLLDDFPVLVNDQIIDDEYYSLYRYETGPLKVFRIDGRGYVFEEGMTWNDFINSDYGTGFNQVFNYVYTPNGKMVWQNIDGEPYGVDARNLIEENVSYFTQEASTNSRALKQYEYDFYVNSISIEVADQQGLLNGIIGWIKNVFDAITGLPEQIASKIGDKLTSFGTWLVGQLRSLFVPSQDSIVDIKEQFDSLLRSRFGAVYDSVEIIDDFAASFVYSSTDSSITFPSVNLNLAGVNFSFGGWEVDVIPDRITGIVSILKSLISMVATVLFVNALRKRLEEILR